MRSVSRINSPNDPRQRYKRFREGKEEQNEKQQMYDFYRTVLIAFYRTHNVKFVKSVDQMLQKHRGRESELMRKICTKYGEHPLDFWALQPSNNIKNDVVFSPPKSNTPAAKEDTSKHGRMVVVLDLDETLIHTTDITDRYSPAIHNPQTLRDQTPEAFLMRVKGEILLCRKRPGVHQFLARASTLFDLVLYVVESFTSKYHSIICIHYVCKSLTRFSYFRIRIPGTLQEKRIMLHRY